MSYLVPCTQAARAAGFGIGKKLGVMYFNDFLTDSDVDADEFVFTAINSTIPTTVTDAPGGHLTLTNAAADLDSLQWQLTGETVKLGLGTRVDFFIRHKPTEGATDVTDWAFGLAITDTTFGPGASDVLLLRVDDGDDNVDFSYGMNVSGSARANETTTVIDTDGFVSATWITYWVCVEMDATVAGQGRVRIWKFDEPRSVAPSKLYDSVVTGLPYDEELALSGVISNGSANASSQVIDYVGLFADVNRSTT